MNAIKRHPLFTAWVILCVILATGESVWLQHSRQLARRESAGVTRKIQERERLLQSVRAAEPVAAEEPSIGTGAAVVAPPEAGPVPRHPVDAFIAIAAAKEALRRTASRQEVALLPDEGFGFATYAHAGPFENQLESVHRQLSLVRTVTEKLFAARPDKLIAVRRERPPGNERDGATQSVADFFVVDAWLDRRIAGVAEGEAVQVEFSGSSRTLRDFLESLAGVTEPLLVCSVEAEPLQGAENRTTQGKKFTVVVERVKPVVALAALALADAAVAPALWAAADPALFDSPEGKTYAPEVSAPIPADAGLELLAVKREPYRLQLVGYFGARGDYTAAFVSPGSNEMLLARAGHRFESLGLTVKSLAVRPRERAGSAGAFGDEVTACAEVWDERKQEIVTLVGAERRLTDTPLAIIRLDASARNPREFRTGDAFRVGTSQWRIEQIQLDPAEVTLVQQPAGLAESERKVMRLNDGPGFPARAELASSAHAK